MKYFSKNKWKQLQAKFSFKMSQPVVVQAVKKIIKIKLTPHLLALIKPKPVEPKPVEQKPVEPVAVVEEPQVMKKSIWMSYRREPKAKPQTFVWDNVEDISDDEGGTPQAAGKRLSMMKATRDQIRRRAYENKIDELQSVGLFRGWKEPKPIEPHPEQYTPFKYTVTAAYPN